MKLSAPQQPSRNATTICNSMIWNRNIHLQSSPLLPGLARQLCVQNRPRGAVTAACRKMLLASRAERAWLLRDPSAAMLEGRRPVGAMRSVDVGPSCQRGASSQLPWTGRWMEMPKTMEQFSRAMLASEGSCGR
ncbi:hypothetical protein BaRGS_00009361 [Batillaria attramentaria]|uniref:Uncharacterized protein n=1 Tax=Batillaria attramentaria TaxID=370345 RepID=A0ABD0LJB7_9CAEN